MTRLHFNDKLQSFRFHLLDISWNQSGLPYVFSPVAGFSSISSPEFTMETEEIQEGVSLFKHDIKGKVSVSPVSLSRGVAVDDSEFWRWFVSSAMRTDPANAGIGVTGERRTLLLIQFTNYGVGAIDGVSGFASALNLASGGFIPNFEGFAKVPGKAWILSGCLPTRYKATSDLDGASSDISIAEIEVKPHLIEELTLIP